jgi:arylsulfatase A-like enzyme
VTAAAPAHGAPRERGPAATGSRRWLALLWALALLFPVGALLQPWLWPSRSGQPIVARQLNAPVILVTVAGLRADRMHHLGYARDITPSLDRMAEQGTSFRSFYSSSNDAAETMASLLAGRCPSRSGGPAGPGSLPPFTMTLPGFLDGAGYASTALLANPELLDRGLEQGFDEVRAMPGASADEVLGAALDAIHADAGNRYFLWIDLAELLAPYGGPDLDPALLARLAPDAPPGFGASAEDYDLDAAELVRRGWSLRELGWLGARYDAALASLDAALGRFVDALHAEHRLETLTLVVVGSRGERLDDRIGRAFTHGIDLYEHSIRVPCLVRLPAQQARGQITQRLAQTVDLGPTLADLGTRREWKTPAGISLTKLVREQHDPNKFITSEGRVQPRRDEPGGRGLVLRPGAYKLLCTSEGAPREIYKVTEDPREEKPMKLGAEQIEILLGRCKDWLERCAPR